MEKLNETTLPKGLEKLLDAYIKEKHTLDECVGYTDGLKDGAEWQNKQEWISVDMKLPELSGEYNVTWDIEDGDYPVVTSMDYDSKTKIWTDPRGTGEPENILFWCEKPKPPANIPKEVWEIKEFKEPFIPKSLDDFERKVYGQCPHGENMINCSECNPDPITHKLT